MDITDPRQDYSQTRSCLSLRGFLRHGCRACQTLDEQCRTPPRPCSPGTTSAMCRKSASNRASTPRLVESTPPHIASKPPRTGSTRPRVGRAHPPIMSKTPAEPTSTQAALNQHRIQPAPNRLTPAPKSVEPNPKSVDPVRRGRTNPDSGRTNTKFGPPGFRWNQPQTRLSHPLKLGKSIRISSGAILDSAESPPPPCMSNTLRIHLAQA